MSLTMDINTSLVSVILFVTLYTHKFSWRRINIFYVSKYSWVKDKLVMDDEMTSIHKMKVDKENYDFNKILI